MPAEHQPGAGKVSRTSPAVDILLADPQSLQDDVLG
jgi:hypothetical protein